MAGRRREFRLEYPCHSPDRKRWFSLSITRFLAEEPLRIVVSHEEITERKRAEDRVREREEHYRSLIEHAMDIITIIMTRVHVR